MTQSMTPVAKADCGCGCGGASTWPSAFVRPRFFAGQLLTEDDLGLLVEYMTGKTRLHNRSMYGPGVVCGFEVGCDPCGGGAVTVHPGHALDCCGNDIVLSCKEKVDVAALVREMRVTSLGVECGDGCDDGDRRYGLYVRYEETQADPVAPYATEEPCPSPGCLPSRVREGLRFVVKCADTEDHRYNPGTRLLASIGPLVKYQPVQARARRLELYLDPMVTARAVGTRPIEFDALDAERYATSLRLLQDSGDGGDVAPDVAAAMTEQVRALAAAVARYDTHDDQGRERIRTEFNLGDVDTARQVLGSVCERLARADPEKVWPDEVRRSIGLAVIAETRARVGPDAPGADAGLELRLLAQGTPVSDALQVELRSDLAMIREWLLGRLDRAPGVSDCTLRDLVRTTPVPRLLPAPEPGDERQLTIAELAQIEDAAAALTSAVTRFVTDAACATLNPPCTDCTDTDVLLAHLELDDCDVVRVCSATREQVLPGGSAYGEWLSKLYPLRELAERMCCKPVAVYREPPVPDGDGPVSRPYVDELLGEWPHSGDLQSMWDLLLTPAPGETPPKELHEQIYTVPSEVTDSLHELSVLRAQIRDLTANVEALHAQLDTARDQVGQVREELPERLGQRLEELESTPPPSKEKAEPEQKEEPAKPAARRTRSSSSRTQKPRSGDSS
jgi:hypothetical protein